MLGESHESEVRVLLLVDEPHVGAGGHAVGVVRRVPLEDELALALELVPNSVIIL